jgi:hypothetical protein
LYCFVSRFLEATSLKDIQSIQFSLFSKTQYIVTDLSLNLSSADKQRI